MGTGILVPSCACLGLLGLRSGPHGHSWGLLGIRSSWALLGPPGPSWAPVVQKGALLGRVIGAPFGAVWRRLAPFGAVWPGP